LRISNQGRAAALEALGRHVEATAAWERALEMDDGSNKEEIHSCMVVSRFHGSRKAKDAAGCVASAAEYEALNRSEVTDLYNAACYRAVCATVILEDPKVLAADAARLA